MNDSELESKLKSVPLPERTAEYWGNFPVQTRGQLRLLAPQHLRASGGFQFAWKMSLGFAGAMLALFIFNQPMKTAADAIFNHEKIIRKQLAELPVHLRVLMADEHGMHYLIAEQP